MADFGLLSRNYITPSTVPEVDPTRATRQAYSLAGGLADVQGKIREEQQTAGDINAMQGFLRSGGDLHSNEGWDKALTELKGVISPKSYMELVTGKQKFQANTQKQIEALAEQPEKVIKAARTTNDEILRTFEGISEVYDKASKANDPEALAKFQAAKAVNLQRLRELPGMNNQQALARFESMSPEQLAAEIRATEHYGKVLDESTKARKQLAEAARAEALTEQIKAGGPLVTAYTAMVEEYGEDSPQAKAALAKLQGGAGATRFPPVDMATQKGQDAVEAATWDLIMKGSKPSAIGGMQQAVYARLTEIGRANNMEPGDVLAASADFKSRMLAKAQLERRIQNTQRAENQIIAELPVMKAAMANLSLPSIPLAARGKIAVLRQLGDPNVTRLDQSAEAILNEFQSIMTGNPGALNVADVEHARQQYKTIQTPQQMAAWIDQAENMIKRAKAAGVKTREEVMGEARAILPGGKKGEKERGADDLETLIKQMETALADTKPGTGSYDRIKKDLDEARGELAKLKPGAPTTATPAAPASAPAKAGPPKLNSFNDLKRLVSEGKLKKGDEFIGPDGKSYTVKKLPE